MKTKNRVGRMLSILLVFVLILGLCSCKSKNEDETTSQTDISSTQDTTVQPTGENTLMLPEDESQSEDASQQSEQPTANQEQTVTQTSATQSQQQQEQTVVTTGTETITDGNKTVVFPAALRSSDKSFPVIAWANGTGCPTQTYMSLLTSLANGGYIIVADSSVMTADGTSQIDSIDYILNQNNNSSSIFYNRIDTSKIGACGHSQGGRSCVNAAQKDSRIRCIVSIAGASSAEEANGLKTPCLFLTGTNDLVVVSGQWCKPSYDAVAGRAAYASLKGGIHTTCMTNPEKVSGYALSWFDAYLKNDSSAKDVFVNGGRLSSDSAWQDFQNKN